MAQLTVVANRDEAAAHVAQRLVDTIVQARAAGRAPVHIALAGGTTPAAAYERAAALEPDWSGVELWLGDERAVAPEDPESNERMVRETLLSRLTSGQPTLHGVAWPGTTEELARAYARTLTVRVPAGADGIPALDLALQGLGEDGHTASLFPDQPTLDVTDALVIPVHDSPKPPPDRITFTLPVLRAPRAVIVLATGEGKADAAAALVRDPDRHFPASLLTDLPNAEVVLDEAAASRIPAEARA